MVGGRPRLRLNVTRPCLAESGGAGDCKIDFHFCGSHPCAQLRPYPGGLGPSLASLGPSVPLYSRRGSSARAAPAFRQPHRPSAPSAAIAAVGPPAPSFLRLWEPRRTPHAPFWCRTGASVGVEDCLIDSDILANGSRFLGRRMIGVGSWWRTVLADHRPRCRLLTLIIWVLPHTMRVFRSPQYRSRSRRL